MNTKIYKTKVILYNEEGKIVDEMESSLDVKNGNINDIETAVTGFKKSILGEIECKILEEEQRLFIEKKK